jgi:hypothetical protein
VAARVVGPDSGDSEDVETKEESTLYAADIDEGREYGGPEVDGGRNDDDNAAIHAAAASVRPVEVQIVR